MSQKKWRMNYGLTTCSGKAKTEGEVEFRRFGAKRAKEEGKWAENNLSNNRVTRRARKDESQEDEESGA